MRFKVEQPYFKTIVWLDQQPTHLSNLITALNLPANVTAKVCLDWLMSSTNLQALVMGAEILRQMPGPHEYVLQLLDRALPFANESEQLRTVQRLRFLELTEYLGPCGPSDGIGEFLLLRCIDLLELAEKIHPWDITVISRAQAAEDDAYALLQHLHLNECPYDPRKHNFALRIYLTFQDYPRVKSTFEYILANCDDAQRKVQERSLYDECYASFTRSGQMGEGVLRLTELLADMSLRLNFYQRASVLYKRIIESPSTAEPEVEFNDRARMEIRLAHCYIQQDIADRAISTIKSLQQTVNELAGREALRAEFEQTTFTQPVRERASRFEMVLLQLGLVVFKLDRSLMASAMGDLVATETALAKLLGWGRCQ